MLLNNIVVFVHSSNKKRIMVRLTSKEEEILGYFWAKGPLFVRELLDLQEESKPHYNTLSTIVRSLEEKGYIEKRTAADNKKHVDLLLSDSADELIQDGIRVQKQFAEDMLRGLTEEEIAMCKQVFQKICDNAERCIKEKGQR